MNRLRLACPFAVACSAPLLMLWACDSDSSGTAGAGTLDGGGISVDGTSNDSTVANDGTSPGDSGDAGTPGEAGGPVLIATGFDAPRSIASDGTSVFFFASGWHEDGGLNAETRLVQVPISGGPMTTRFAYGGANPQGTGELAGGIVVDGANVFFCANSHGWRMPIASGSPAVDLSGASAPPTGFNGCQIPIVDAVNFYSGGDSNDPSMFSVPKGGGAASEFAGPDLPNTAAIGGPAMASDGTYVYWVPFSGDYSHTMQRALGTGGPTETFIAAPNPDAGALGYLGYITSNLVFTGGNLYWMEFGTGFLPTYLWKASTSGSTATPTVVAQGNTFYEGIISDGAFIYWFEGNNGLYSIKKTSVAGGGPITTVVTDAFSIAASAPGPPQYAVDSTNVYWLDAPNLYKAAK